MFNSIAPRPEVGNLFKSFSKLKKIVGVASCKELMIEIRTCTLQARAILERSMLNGKPGKQLEQQNLEIPDALNMSAFNKEMACLFLRGIDVCGPRVLFCYCKMTECINEVLC